MSQSDYKSLMKICEARRSCRSFSNKPVDRGLLEKIKTIALSTPYASGKKNWDFLIVDDKIVISRIAEQVRIKCNSLKPLIREDFVGGYESYSKNFTMFETAPALIFLNFRAPASFTLMFDKEIPESDEVFLKEWERDNYVKSISCAAMLVLLAAESLGLGACYMTGPIVAEDLIKEIIKVKPGRRIGAIIPIGYKSEDK